MILSLLFPPFNLMGQNPKLILIDRCTYRGGLWCASNTGPALYKNISIEYLHPLILFQMLVEFGTGDTMVGADQKTLLEMFSLNTVNI